MTPLVVESTAWWIPVVSGLAGGLVGVAGALLASRLTQNREDARRRRSQLDAIRAAKADRLRDLYAPLANAALLLHAVVRAQSFVLEGDTVAKRDERHDEQIRAAFRACQEIAGQLGIEPEATPVNNRFNQLTVEFMAYFQMLRLQKEQPGTYTVEVIRAAESSLEQGMQEVVGLARTQLTELERPAE